MSSGFEELTSSALDLEGDLATRISASLWSVSSDDKFSLESISGFLGRDKSRLTSISGSDAFEPLPELRSPGFATDLSSWPEVLDDEEDEELLELCSLTESGLLEDSLLLDFNLADIGLLSSAELSSDVFG